MQQFVECVILIFVVEDGYYVVEPIGEKADDILDILLSFVSVADDEDVLVEQLLLIQLLYEVDVECRRSLEVDVVFECFFQHKAEMAGLGAIAIVVVALVVGLCYSYVEHAFGALYLGGYFGQVGNF